MWGVYVRTFYETASNPYSHYDKLIKITKSKLDANQICQDLTSQNRNLDVVYFVEHLDRDNS